MQVFFAQLFGIAVSAVNQSAERGDMIECRKLRKVDFNFLSIGKFYSCRAVAVQGMQTESVPLGELKKLAEDQMLLFDEKLMQYTMGNCIVMEDTNGNRKLLKKRYDHKIDAVAATMDAYVAWGLNTEEFE